MRKLITKLCVWYLSQQDYELIEPEVTSSFSKEELDMWESVCDGADKYFAKAVKLK